MIDDMFVWEVGVKLADFVDFWGLFVGFSQKYF